MSSDSDTIFVFLLSHFSKLPPCGTIVNNKTPFSENVLGYPLTSINKTREKRNIFFYDLFLAFLTESKQHQCGAFVFSLDGKTLSSKWDGLVHSSWRWDIVFKSQSKKTGNETKQRVTNHALWQFIWSEICMLICLHWCQGSKNSNGGQTVIGSLDEDAILIVVKVKNYVLFN